MAEISIIVPVYNCEKYIERCIKSILCQTFKDFELILVNDGSEDGSRDICEIYAKKDPRIKVLSQDNKGVSAARNAGLDVAKGEYVGFVDADDFIHEKMYEILYGNLVKRDAQVSVCGVGEIYEDIKKMPSIKNRCTVFNTQEAMEMLFSGKFLTMYAVNKLYKRNLFETIRYPVGKIYEDTVTTPKIFCLVSKIVYTPDFLYFYARNSQSITMSGFSNKDKDITDAGESVLKLAKEKFPDLLVSAEFRWLWSYWHVTDKIIISGVDKFKKEYAQAKSVIRNNFMKIICNPYFSLKRKMLLPLLFLNIRIYKKIISRKFVQKKEFKTKRICFIDYNISNMGGIERVLASLCNLLCSKYEVHLITLCGKCENCVYPLNKKIKCKDIGNPSGERIRKTAVKSFFALKKYINENNMDITFLVGNYVPPAVLPVKFFTKSKFVYCDHGALKNELKKKKITFFRWMASKFCDKTVVLVESTKEDYKKIFKISEKKIDYIYNFADPDIFKYVKNYNKESKLILSSGRFTREKGFDLVPEIGAAVFKNHPEWQWHIYGDGEEMSAVREKIKKYKLENNIFLMGRADNMYAKYCDYSIFVLPSYREGFALVLLEAKANKLPLVSFNCVAGPCEIIRSGVDGYLISCYDKSQMADKICGLMDSDELRLKFSGNSYGNLEKFSQDKILSKWTELIDTL